jgi:hypothetical protein
MGLIELAQIPRMRALEDLIADFSRLVEGGGPRPPGSPAAHRKETAPAPAAGNRAHAPAAPDPLAAGAQPPAGQAEPVAPPAIPAGKALQEGRSLIDRIAAAVQKESLAPILHSLSGARLTEKAVILDLGSQANEFQRRQLRENLDAVAQAAAAVVGRPLQVQFGDSQAEVLMPAPPAGKPSEGDILERAKKQPAVRSFLDTFPGPVKAEKI